MDMTKGDRLVFEDLCMDIQGLHGDIYAPRQVIIRILQGYFECMHTYLFFIAFMFILSSVCYFYIALSLSMHFLDMIRNLPPS